VCKDLEFDTIFTMNGRTYIIVGPFTYLFNDANRSVEPFEPWPRLTKEVFGIDIVHEAIEHDGFVYMFEVSILLCDFPAFSLLDSVLV